MPTIIPTRRPDNIRSMAECRLFTALQEGLSDEWTVVHSLPWIEDEGGHISEGECDFLLLHPRHGMLAVEAKSGEVRYDGSQKQWYYGNGKEMKDPFLQAQDSVKRLNRLLNNKVLAWRGANLAHGHAAAFPETDRMTGPIPPHVSPGIVLFKSDMDRLEDWATGVLERFARDDSGAAALKPDQMTRVLDVLLPVFYIHRSVAETLADRDERLFRLTQEQIKVLDHTGHNRRLLIEGCAGSGKTVIAKEDAARLADEGARVLFVCFNVPLAEAVRGSLADRASGIDVMHFHGLCEQVVKECGGAWPEDAGAFTQDFFDTGCPQLMLDHVPGFQKRYDAIIADEAQDFCAEWWLALDELLADKKTGVMHLYTDPKQNIFERDNALPFNEPSVRLDVNCRNTSEIAQLVHTYGATPAGHQGDPESGDVAVHGPDPVVREVASAAEERAAIEQAVAEAIQNHAIPPERIVVIGAHRLEHSALAGVEKLGAHPLEDESAAIPFDGAQGRPGVVRYATIWRFKGLECDCAILTGFDVAKAEAGDVRERRLLYVAASRAKHLLCALKR